MAENNGSNGNIAGGAPGSPGDGWGTDALHTLLFGGGPVYPSFRLRAAVLLGKDEYRLESSSPEDDYRIGEEERGRIAAAFHGAFPKNRGAVPTDDGDADVLAGSTTVEERNAAKAWNSVVNKLFGTLSGDGAVRDPGEALKALDFLYLEVAEEVFEDLVARALSGEVSGGIAPASDTFPTEDRSRQEPTP